MIDRMYKKGLVVGIIILFVAVAVAPSINANIGRLPVKSKLVETSVRIHHSNGITPYTLKLTEKESDEVDRIFDNLKVSLDSAESGEEIDEIYDDAVESLYKLGLFLRMTLKEAKQLVNGNSAKTHSGNIGTCGGNCECKVAGETTLTFMHDLANPIRNFILEFLFRGLLGWFVGHDVNFQYYNGKIGSISFGTYDKCYSPYYVPSEGWVWTDGTNGVVKWNGSFYGARGERQFYGPTYESLVWVFDGVTNFEGLWIDRWFVPPCYLGNAEHVNLRYDKPPSP
jgi:hypothetical protein